MKYYNQKETVEKINAYIARYKTNEDLPIKDFMNIYTGRILCGKCNKEMSAFESLFHFHIK